MDAEAAYLLALSGIGPLDARAQSVGKCRRQMAARRKRLGSGNVVVIGVHSDRERARQKVLGDLTALCVHCGLCPDARVMPRRP